MTHPGGTRFETEVVKYVAEKGIQLWRLPKGGSRDPGDLGGLAHAAIQCKNRKAYLPIKWHEEAARQAKNANKSIGILIARSRNRFIGKAKVSMDLDTFIQILLNPSLLTLEKALEPSPTRVTEGSKSTHSGSASGSTN